MTRPSLAATRCTLVFSLAAFTGGCAVGTSSEGGLTKTETLIVTASAEARGAGLPTTLLDVSDWWHLPVTSALQMAKGESRIWWHWHEGDESKSVALRVPFQEPGSAARIGKTADGGRAVYVSGYNPFTSIGSIARIVLYRSSNGDLRIRQAAIASAKQVKPIQIALSDDGSRLFVWDEITARVLPIPASRLKPVLPHAGWTSLPKRVPARPDLHKLVAGSTANELWFMARRPSVNRSHKVLLNTPPGRAPSLTVMPIVRR